MTNDMDSNSNKRKQTQVDSDGNQKLDSVFEPDSKQDKQEDASTSAPSEPPSKTQKLEHQGNVNETSNTSNDEEETYGKDKMDAKEKEAQAEKLQVDQVGVEKTSSDEDDNQYTIMERGHIFFFYRPKVQPASEDSSHKLAGSLNQVQSFHILLLPGVSSSPNVNTDGSGNAKDSASKPSASTGEKARAEGVGFRLLRVGKKRLPEAEMVIARGETPGGIGGDSAETLWAEVSDVGGDISELQGTLGETRYATRTVGKRLVGSSRAAGRGHYVLSLKHAPDSAPSQKQVQLSYVLSHPTSDDFGPVQEAFALHESSSLDLKIRNPTLAGQSAGGPPGLDESQKAQLSKEELKENFGGDAEGDGTNYGIPEHLGLLDKTGIELLVIKSRKQEVDGDQGMGDDQMKALKGLADSDSKSMSSSDVLKELNLSAKDHPVEALEGAWI